MVGPVLGVVHADDLGVLVERRVDLEDGLLLVGDPAGVVEARWRVPPDQDDEVGDLRRRRGEEALQEAARKMMPGIPIEVSERMGEDLVESRGRKTHKDDVDEYSMPFGHMRKRAIFCSFGLD